MYEVIRDFHMEKCPTAGAGESRQILSKSHWEHYFLTQTLNKASIVLITALNTRILISLTHRPYYHQLHYEIFKLQDILTAPFIQPHSLA